MNRKISSKSLSFFVSLISVLVLVACKTSGDIRAEKMNQDPGEIKTITAPNQQSQQAPARAQTQNQQSQVQNVNEDLARQIEVLKGEVQEKEYLANQQKTQYEARIQALEQDKARLNEEMQILKGNAPPAAMEAGDLLWQSAQKNLMNRKYSEAVSNLKDFLESFPKDARAEEALILKGKSEYAAEQFKASLVTFGNYLDKYPKGKGRPAAWLGQGAALIRLKQKKDAKLFLEQCVSLHPKTKEAKLAKRLLKTPNFVPPTIFL